MSISEKLLSFFKTQRAVSGPTPTRLTYAVGDIHGRLDLLEGMLARIEADREGRPADVVFLGDYIDRGPHSASVLRRLKTLTLANADIVCLMGNHERMFLDFLENPEQAGLRWLENGGRETLESFAGIDWEPPKTDSFETACRAKIVETAEAGLIDWIKGLPLQWRSGDLGCVHAMTDPRTPWDAQTEAVLLWGRPKPNLPRRSDGIWVVHGHTVVDSVTVQNRRIPVDLGGFKTGVLAAVRCEDEAITVLTSSGADRG